VPAAERFGRTIGSQFGSRFKPAGGRFEPVRRPGRGGLAANLSDRLACRLPNGLAEQFGRQIGSRFETVRQSVWGGLAANLSDRLACRLPNRSAEQFGRHFGSAFHRVRQRAIRVSYVAQWEQLAYGLH
jgi:hypothetical protein